ncbi:metallopeptidase TldD-related protein [Xanthomonas campestris pv. phormiicola]|nr:metalloprotease TldD [Xanthomonas campestris pv. phormiicola]UYC15752.1 metallopeptidase TldD-related protein [Xanthomonas campestris pv. phormiicola]
MSQLQSGAASMMDRLGITSGYLDRWLGMIDSGTDRGELFFQQGWREEVTMEQGRITGGRHTAGSGVGVRSEHRRAGSRFASTNSLASRDVDAACRIVAHGDRTLPSPGKPFEGVASRANRGELGMQERVHILNDLDGYARKTGLAITDMALSLGGAWEDILVTDTTGLHAVDQRPQAQFRCQLAVERRGHIGRASSGAGGRVTYTRLASGGYMHDAIDTALRMAVAELTAQPAPEGTMPLVFAPGWNGMLLHETVGHCLEADPMQAGTSVFAGKRGQRVASACVTVIDDGTLAGLWGSGRIDDEGRPSSKVLLLEQGILGGLLHDSRTAAIDGVCPTGNARRQSYAHRPMPRMTNTYLAAGEHHPDEIIGSVANGVYARTLGGGQVHPVTGRFVFEVVEAYLISQGRLGAPLKRFSVAGNVHQFLQDISMVGNDLAMDPGIGRCVKRGQTLTVSVGQPTIRVDGLTIAGTR